MKRSLVFTILLVINFCNKSVACYFYPYGEDIRFSVFNPDNFNFDGFRIYNYTSTYFYDENFTTRLNTITENDLMWYNHCKKSVAIEEIKEAIFEIDISEVNPKSKNKFIQYLYNQHDYQTINYLLFAKKAEELNPEQNDLWENNTDVKDKLRGKTIDDAFDKIKSVQNLIIKKRYYYQIFKLLSFNGDSKGTIKLYDAYIKSFKTNDFLDSWALFYRMQAEPNDTKMNYLAAQVFARGTDNKFDVKWYFNKNISIEKVLKFAKNEKEKANIQVLYSFRRLDYNLENIKKIYALDGKNRGLNFLLLREINKLEDWILTPTYTMYLPSLREDYWENSSGSRILNRVEVDRKYASKVLQFVNSVDMNAVEDPIFWKMSKSYLEFLTKDYSKSLATIKSFEPQIKDYKLKRQCAIVKALALTANQNKSDAKILKSIEKTVVDEYKKGNYSFLFGLAKELEILENKAAAAFLVSKITSQDHYGENSGFYWKSRSNKITLQDDFYYDWYGYVDAELSTLDLQKIIETINSLNTTQFNRWLVGNLQKERNKINDLMGIKYMREDNLKMAYNYFLKVDKNHYTNAPLFNENPFYKIKGYMNFDAKKSTANLTKAKVVATLMQLENRVNNANNKNRDRDYFLIANCYYNMSYYGNSWMMKRISRTEGRDSNYNDEKEYYCCKKAKSYYKKAFESSKSKKFKALSQYMMAKCQARENEHKVISKYEKYYYVDYHEVNRANNDAFARFINQYRDDYDAMTSNCEYFSIYFKSR
ncbi:hypothetical protein [Flavobacterium sp.]|uniref:hypothetical protein n=1 Tax=Flavobacterium sp. TaxID=239 RepID=UPI002B4B392A|nr:hypothetical protein [Flavobacterium sp.]HLP63770.1 hypothetical protein [Flavobacterium sp.]